MIERLADDCVNIPTVRNKLNELIDLYNQPTEACTLTLTRDYFSDEPTYRLRLVLPGIVQWRQPDDSAIWFESDFEADDDDHALRIATTISQRLGVTLDVNLVE